MEMKWSWLALSRILCSVALCAVMLPRPAVAQDSSDSWQWRATVYGWFSGMGGTVKFPSGGEADIDVGFDDILDSLDFTFMGALDARKGSWGFFTDVVYLDTGGSVTNSRDFSLGPGQVPGNVELAAGVDVKSWLWTATGLYNFSRSERHSSDILFGARMVDIESTLDWSFSGDIGQLPLPGRSGNSKISDTLWDVIIGIKGHALLGAQGKWVLPYHFDIGTGDSDFTWQAMAGIGYQFGWGTMVLNYRYLDYDMESDAVVQALDISGPMIGASFHW